MAWPHSAYAAENRVIAGWVENVKLANNGDVLKAKLDTGAKTSSINALDIKRFKRDGQEWVRFRLEYKTTRGKKRSQTLERPVSRNVQIKEHKTSNHRRAVVELKFCFAGQWRQAEFSLVDRSKFIYPVLLGRRFLQTHSIIDPAATFLTHAQCISPRQKDHE